MYLGHTHQAQADRMREFFLCAMGSTMSRQLNLFGKPVVRKAGPYRSPSNRHEKFVNAYVACNPGLPLKEAKRKADDEWRETGNGKNEEEVEMMLSAEAFLEEKDKKDKKLAGSSFVVDKRGFEEGRHRFLSENVRQAFRIEGGGRGVKPI